MRCSGPVFPLLENVLWLDTITGPVRNLYAQNGRTVPDRGFRHFFLHYFKVPETAGSSDGMNPVVATKTLLLQKERVVRLLKRVAREVEDEETRPKRAKIIEMCTRHTLTDCTLS
jgi:hypothetical protein